MIPASRRPTDEVVLCTFTQFQWTELSPLLCDVLTSAQVPTPTPLDCFTSGSGSLSSSQGETLEFLRAAETSLSPVVLKELGWYEAHVLVPVSSRQTVYIYLL